MDSKDRGLRDVAVYGGKPYKTYKKTILGKVYVTTWDRFENQPVGVILEGDPRKNDESCLIDVWSEQDDYFFRNKNRTHLTTGDVIQFERTTEERERTIEEYTDEELKAVVNSKFFTIQNVLNSTESIAVLFRLKGIAQDEEKSDKIIKAIEARISEVQANEFKPLPKVMEHTV